MDVVMTIVFIDGAIHATLEVKSKWKDYIIWFAIAYGLLCLSKIFYHLDYIREHRME